LRITFGQTTRLRGKEIRRAWGERKQEKAGKKGKGEAPVVRKKTYIWATQDPDKTFGKDRPQKTIQKKETEMKR